MQDHDSTAQLPIGKDKYALVDADDLEWLSRWKWFPCAVRNRYVCRNSLSSETGTWKIHKTYYLHRVVTEAGDGQSVDHVNQDGWDNRRCNLRIANKSQNMSNKPKQANNTSGFKGVAKITGTHKWRARINCNKREHTLGYFDSPEAAARAYDAKAIELFGEFACLNFPEDH